MDRRLNKFLVPLQLGLPTFGSSFPNYSGIFAQAEDNGLVHRFKADHRRPKSLAGFQEFLETVSENAALADFQQFLETAEPENAIGLISGDLPSAAFISLLTQNHDRFLNLVAVSLGDTTSGLVSPIHLEPQSLANLLASFPLLEVLRVRTNSEPFESAVEHANLQALLVEPSCLSFKTLRCILASKLPKLEHLQISCGSIWPPSDIAVEDLLPLLRGNQFRKLKYLGLLNFDSGFMDDLVGVLVNSPLIRRIETLDLRGGAIGESGVHAFLSLDPHIPLLEIAVSWGWVRYDLLKKIVDLPFHFNT